MAEPYRTAETAPSPRPLNRREVKRLADHLQACSACHLDATERCDCAALLTTLTAYQDVLLELVRLLYPTVARAREGYRFWPWQPRRRPQTEQEWVDTLGDLPRLNRAQLALAGPLLLRAYDLVAVPEDDSDADGARNGAVAPCDAVAAEG